MSQATNAVAEFGDTTDIEKSLTVNQESASSTEWIPLANGCICCSAIDSGVAALESLVDRSSNTAPFDYILLETTGVADPGNVAPMFWLDEGLGSTIRFDGIVTVVDAKNILKSLDEPTTEEIPNEEDHAQYVHQGPLMSIAHLQISHADIILLNKTDLASQSELEVVSQRIRSINGLAKVIRTEHSLVPDLSGTVLDLDAYSTFPTMPPFHDKGHSHLDASISTITIPLPPFEEQKLSMLENYLQTVLWDVEGDREYEVHRTKGYINVLDGKPRVVQGVREIFEIIEVDGKQDQEEQQEGKIVFIGRNLDKVPGI